jgi:chromosome segregation ATPase
LDQVREGQRDVESLRRQLADSQAECGRLGEQTRALEVQVAEMAGLQARLEAAEASARELDVIRGERDRWLTEAQDLQTRLVADSAEREEWRQQLEAAQQQLVGEHETLRQQLEEARAEHAQLCARVPELEGRANSADRLWTRLRNAGAKTERLRVQLRTAESRQAELETVRAECDRLSEQARALEVQVAEMAALQARLEAAEASAGELDVVRGERDRWLAEAQDLQARLATNSAEREEWRQRLEAAQQQLVEEREAVRAAGMRLEQESAILQNVRADLTARNAEHGTALQLLHEAHDELARLQDTVHSLQAGLDKALEGQRDVEALRQQLEEARAEHAQLCARVPELEGRANSADRLRTRLRDAGAKTERLRVQLRATESRQVELETVRAECARLNEQTRALEVQVAEMAALQARLEAAEASARELDVIRGERDRWLTEAQDLQTRLAADSAEQEEWRQRLEAAQQQLVGEHETLKQQLEEARAEHAQLCARVPELEGRANSADRLRTRLHDAGAKTEQLRVQLRAAESRQAELETVRAECDRLSEQTRALEVQVAEMAALQARLEAAEASAGELDVIRGERDRWLAEAQDLQAKLATESAEREQLGRLAVDLLAAQADRDRLQTEQQTSQHSAEQAWARVSDLERALTEAATAHETALEEARVHWESERQALEARLELERQTHSGAVQAALGDVQAQAIAERQEWRQRLEGAERQLVWERGMFQEQSEQIRQQVASLQAERDRLAARLAQTELRLRAAEEHSPDEVIRTAELQKLRQQAAQDQVFVQLSGMRLRHLQQQIAQAQNANVPAEQAHPGAPPVRERALVEEQRRLTATAQELQTAWEETAAGQEWLPGSWNPPGRVGEQAAAEAGLDADGEKAVEDQSAPAAPPADRADEGEASTSSDAPQGSAAPLGERQPVEDAPSCLPQPKDSRPEARQRLWWQILGFGRGK